VTCPEELGREVTSPSAADAGAGTGADVADAADVDAAGAAGAGVQHRHFWASGEELTYSWECRGGESGVVHAMERAHESTDRARKSGLVGWGRRAGAAVPRNTSDGPQNSAGKRQGLWRWRWNVRTVGKGASGVASAARCCCCCCYPRHRWWCCQQCCKERRECQGNF
jgi:hypothetical protein